MSTEEAAALGATRHPRDTSKNLNLLALFFNGSMTYAISPFFSSYAKHELRMSTGWIGFVFAAFPLGYVVATMFLSCANISHFRISSICRMIRVSMLVMAAASALFGLCPDFAPTSDVNPNVRYGAMFSILRVMQGVAYSTMDVALLMYCTKLFPGQVSKVVGENEAIVGLGVVVGPPIGGLLFQLGGFRLPLLVLAGLSAFFAVATWAIVEMSAELTKLHSYSVIPRELLPVEPSTSLTSQDFLEEDEDDVAKRPAATTLNIRRVIALPLFVALGPTITNMLSTGALAFCEAMSPLYFNEKYGVTALQYGFVMGGTAFVYALSCVISGSMMGGENKMFRPHFITCALLVEAVFMFLVGSQFSVIGLNEPSWAVAKGVSIVASVVIGFPLAALQVVGVSLCIDRAKSADRTLVPAAAALVNFGASVGGFLGPTVGGYLVERHDFGDTYFIFTVACAIVAAVYWICFAASRK